MDMMYGLWVRLFSMVSLFSLFLWRAFYECFCVCAKWPDTVVSKLSCICIVNWQNVLRTHHASAHGGSSAKMLD